MELYLRDMKFHAFHGCHAEERLIGGEYLVDVKIVGDFRGAVALDRLEDTADYVRVYQIVKAEMARPSKLIEHVAGRILDSLCDQMNFREGIEVRISKIAPPVNGDMGRAEFVISK